MGFSSKVSGKELMDLLLSLVMLVAAFTILRWGGGSPVEVITAAAVGAGSGFILHELAHKVVAQHYGYWAEYGANWPGLVLMVFMAFSGFLFAAPGGVMITKASGAPLYAPDDSPDAIEAPEDDDAAKKTRRHMLWIALAGPMTNIFLAGFFILAEIFALLFTSGASMTIFNFAFIINMILAAFNMLPFGPFDGKKVFDASPVVWAIVGIPAILVGLIFILP